MMWDRLKRWTGRAGLRWTCILLPCLALVFADDAAAQDDASELQVIVWNVESGGAQPEPISRRIAAFEEVDLYGFSEVQNGQWVNAFAEAAAVGEESEFRSILGTTGGGDRLAIVYDVAELELIGYEELHGINPMGRVRAPLVGHFRIRSTGGEFLFCVNHLYRSREEQRHLQAQLLNTWAREQTIPIVLGGDMNFDWDITSNGNERDRGFDNLTADGVFRWLRPRTITKTQSSTRYNSILDMVFVTDSGRGWTNAPCVIVVEQGDFPDDDTTPDHRPVAAKFIIAQLGTATTGDESGSAAEPDEEEAEDADDNTAVDMLRAQLESLESSIAALEEWLSTIDPADMAVARDHARMAARLKRMRMDAEAVREMIERHLRTRGSNASSD